MNEAAELVSVITPAYNAGKYLRACAESVLGQDYPHLEWIVVDDGSTDDTRKQLAEIAAQDARVVVLTQENAGSAVARNNGLAYARGKYFAFLDADDAWRSDLLARTVPLMRAHGLDILSYGLVEVDEIPPPSPAPAEAGSIAIYRTPWEGVAQGGAYPAPASITDKLYDRARLGDVAFDPRLRQAQDVAYAWQIHARAGAVGVLGETLYYYRRNAGGISRGATSAQRLRSINLLLRSIDALYVRSATFPPAVAQYAQQENGKAFHRSFIRHMRGVKDPALRGLARELGDALLRDGIVRVRDLPFRKRVEFRLSRLLGGFGR